MNKKIVFLYNSVDIQVIKKIIKDFQGILITKD